MKINFNPGLNLKTVQKPVLKASAEQLADAGKVIWSALVVNKQAMIDTYIPLEMPKKYTNGEELVKWATAKKGDVFKKGFFGVYKLNKNGKNVIKNILYNIGLPENTSTGVFIGRVIRRLRGIK